MGIILTVGIERASMLFSWGLKTMDWGLVTSIIFGLIIVVLTIVAIRTARRKKPVWAYSTRHIIGRDAEAPPELKYIFGTKEVTEVYKTTIIFFNMGNDKFCGDLVPIGSSDLNEAVIIKFEGAEILRPPSVQTRSKGVANNFSAEQIKDAPSAIQLHFQILNHNDGAIIDVWHTKCADVEIPNAEITRLKAFARKWPEGFYGGFVIAILFAAMLVWMWLDTVSQAELDRGFVVSLACFTSAYIFFIGTGIRRLLRYIQFPRWSRSKK